MLVNPLDLHLKGEGSHHLLEKLKWLVFFRVAVATILLLTGVAVHLRASGSLLNPFTYTFYPLAGLVYFLSILYIPLIKYSRNPLTVASSQGFVDIVIITFVVYISGGAISPLSFLYILTIMSSTVVSYRSGGFWSASLSSIFYGALVNAEYYNIIPSIDEVVTGAKQPIPEDILYSTASNIVAFYLVAFLSGYLSVQVKKAEDELREKRIDYEALEALNNDIVKNISSGLMTISNDGMITSFNAAAENITGYSLETIYGRHVSAVFPDFENMMQDYNVSGKKENPRWKCSFSNSSGEELYLSFSISPIVSAEFNSMSNIVFFQDLTAFKVMESELQKADRLAAVGKFAASVAHEIRNPLASISGSVEMLKDVSTDTSEERRKKLMEIILREIERLNLMINDFLVYAKPPSLKKTSVSIDKIIEETVEIFLNSKEFSSEDICIAKVENMALSANVDGSQLKQVLWNLLINAAEAMEKGGKINISTRTSVQSEDNKVVQIIVSDEGHGISNENRERLFDPFFTSKESGSGLGLSIAHSIIDAHGGTISYESEVGKGTTFTITLPL